MFPVQITLSIYVKIFQSCQLTQNVSYVNIYHNHSSCWTMEVSKRFECRYSVCHWRLLYNFKPRYKLADNVDCLFEGIVQQICIDDEAQQAKRAFLILNFRQALFFFRCENCVTKRWCTATIMRSSPKQLRKERVMRTIESQQQHLKSFDQSKLVHSTINMQLTNWFN